MGICKGGCDLWIHSQPVTFRHYMHNLEYQEDYLRCKKCDRTLKTKAIIHSNDLRKKQVIEQFMSVA